MNKDTTKSNKGSKNSNKVEKEQLEVNPIEQILSEDNTDPIILYNEKDEPLEFEQIATIPLQVEGEEEERIYSILRPMMSKDEMNDNDVWAFRVDIKEQSISPETDEKIVDRVFNAYNELIDADD